MATCIRFRTLVLLASMPLLWVMAGSMAWAAVHNVTNGNDAGPGSWRQALLNASGDVDPVVIGFLPGIKVQLTSGDAQYTGTQPITVNAGNALIDGGGTGRILLAWDAPQVTINNLRARRGSGTHGGVITTYGHVIVQGSVFTDSTAEYGGAIYVGTDGGDITIIQSTLARNHSSASFTGGGAVYAGGGSVLLDRAILRDNSADGQGGAVYLYWFTSDVEVVDSIFDNNRAIGGGGAIFSGGSVICTRSSFSNNRAMAGGGIASNGDQVELRQCTFSGNHGGAGGAGAVDGNELRVHRSSFLANTTTNRGGALFPREALSVTNSTFFGNEASEGGAIYNNSAGYSFSISHATFAGNSAGDGAHLWLEATPSLFGNVLVNALGAAGCTLYSGSSSSLGYNYDTDGSCGLGGGPGDVSNGPDPQLLAAADYGGPTLTMRPAQGSPLIDAIPLAACHATITIDQRGMARPQGGACTIGAVELAAVSALILLAEPDTLPGGYPAISRLHASLRDASGAPLAGVPVTFSITSGAGTLDATSATTDANGDAYVKYRTSRPDAGNVVEVAAVAGALGDSARITVAPATIILVVAAADAGPDTYRQAVIDAEDATGPVVVDIAAGLTIQLSSGDVVYQGVEPLVLHGGSDDAAAGMKSRMKSGAPVGSPVLDGGGAHRILLAESASSVEVINLVLQNGNADLGGAVYTDTGDIEVIDSTLSGNSAFEGGALYSEFGSVRLRGARSTGNSAVDGAGGAVYTANDVIIVEASTFESNYADDKGGALFSHEGISVRDSTFAGNSAVYSGGAISGGRDISLVNSTLHGNAATGASAQGGAIRSSSGGTLNLRHVTLTGNAAALGAQVYSDGDMRAFATLFADPVGGNNCSVDAISLGYNYDTGNSCDLADPTDTVSGGDPLLLPLADNGGPTATRLPDPTSPLVDAIPTQDCDPGITTDQRAVARPQRSGCDIGAVELAELPVLIFRDGFE
ncbi:MAG TPA: choice-of-anchor Q domain-containing protein [Xanthomonadaceae bacterium]|nr:choice-of-anchor Q domain-containing protein [Xanthomonadaceae bacterium]